MPKHHEIREGLTFDDVLLVPKKSNINSRKQVDIGIQLTTNIKLNIPIISAPMDTVVESTMAIALARLGVLGIIHRFNTIERQVVEIKRVKRVENYFIDNPRTISPSARLKNVLDLVTETGSTSYLVTTEDNTLLGIICKRDYILEKNQEILVKDLMTPFEKMICLKDFVTLEAATEFFKQHKIEKLPVVDEDRKVKGLITSKDVMQSTNTQAVRDGKGRLVVGAALGVKSDVFDRAAALADAGVDIFCLDVAHGHLDLCLDTAKELKKQFPTIPLIVGNIATTEAAEDVRKAGADVIKVGVGPGAACTTRIVTGSGVPQLTAVMDAVKGAGDVPVIADGGIKNSGDVVKALAAGASAVMMGSLLSGTDEAPGKLTMWNGRKVKLYRGMASFAAYDDKPKSADDKDAADFVAEGVDQGFVPHKGSVRDVIKNLEGGIRSGFSYSGAHNLQELWENAEFIKVSPLAFKENGAHDIATA